MNEPRRLLETARGDERKMLEAWSSTRAPARTRARLLAAAAGAAGAAGALAGAHVKGLAMHAAPASAGAVTGTGALAAKWIALAALLVAGSAAVGIVVVQEHADAPTSRVSVVDAASTKAPPASSTREGVPAPALTAPSVTVKDLPSATPPRSNPVATPRPRLASTAKGAAPDLGPQLIELDRVRDALAVHDAEGARERLRAFATEYPASPLAEEAAALRFDACEQAADRRCAARVARDFVARWPASPYAARLRRAVEPTLDVPARDEADASIVRIP